MSAHPEPALPPGAEAHELSASESLPSKIPFENHALNNRYQSLLGPAVFSRHTFCCATGFRSDERSTRVPNDGYLKSGKSRARGPQHIHRRDTYKCRNDPAVGPHGAAQRTGNFRRTSGAATIGHRNFQNSQPLLSGAHLHLDVPAICISRM
jgi:hypothetical protein